MANFFCISTYFKGALFLKALKAEGHKVFFLTSDRLKDAAWPWESIDEVFFAAQIAENQFGIEDIELGFASLLRDNKIDALVALDDYDVEKAAHLREQFRIAGMGHTTHRYFRDKLAMREKAHAIGISQPRFSAVFNNHDVADFLAEVPAPWVLKPRSEAAALGVRKFHDAADLWHALGSLGDERHHFLLEEFIAGEVYHVDALSYQGNVLFQKASKYLDTPFDVVNDGGIFQSVTCDYDGYEELALGSLNRKMLKGLGLYQSASHSEYIRGRETGVFYFLETSARVGGANISEMLEAATGVNLWTEWAKMESCIVRGEEYSFPEYERKHAGIIMSVIGQERPDYASYTDDEIVWKFVDKPFHIGMIISSQDRNRVAEVLKACVDKIQVSKS